MNEGINLSTLRRPVGEDRLPKIIRSISIGCMLLVAFLAVLFFILRSQSALPTLQSQESQLINQLNAQNVKTAKYIFVKDRLAHIKTISGNRLNLSPVITLLQKDMPQSIVVENMSIQPKTFSVRLGSASLDVIHAYVQKVETVLVNDEKVKKLTLDNLSFDQINQRYSVTIEGEM